MRNGLESQENCEHGITVCPALNTISRPISKTSSNMPLKDVTMNVPFQKKPYIKAGRGDWEVIIPRPPKFATHARMRCVDPLSHNPTPKVATLPISDFGCFKGVCGEFSYIRMNNKRKVLEEYEGTWEWDGRKVLGVDYEI